MKRLSQSGSNNFCPELRKNALLISQSHFSNFALHVIRFDIVESAFGENIHMTVKIFANAHQLMFLVLKLVWVRIEYSLV